MVLLCGEGRVEERAGPLITTVDPADIRGLSTTLVFPSGACLGLESRVGRGRLVTPSRVAPTGAAPLPRPCHGRRRSGHAVMGTSRAMAHMKAASSRAMAVTTTLGCLPLVTRRRKRLQRRTWAFQAMSWIGWGSPSRRLRM